MKIDTQFCRSCNARERIIEKGKCIICGNDPKQSATDLPVSEYLVPSWTWLDKYVLVLCVVATLYVLWHVVRWVL